MNDRDFERRRQERQTESDNDWDWYYYEYRYEPYSPHHRSEYDRYNYGRDYPRRYGRDFEPGARTSYGREYQGSNYDYGFETYPFGSSRYGRYSGLGPRGYKRSDERIKDDINDRLTWHGYIDASDIDVEVNDGIVTVKGTVEDRHQKRMAEDVIENVSGVEDVNNQLKIRNRSWGRDEGAMGGMTAMNRQFRPGMQVVGRDGENVGEVKEVRSNDFLVDRPMARDIYIPFHACQTTGGQIRLNIRADEVDNQGWEMPELFETETDTSRRSTKRR